MAASILAEPGTLHGPCHQPCQHRDCAEVRLMAGGVCRLCGQSIGFGRRYYTDPDRPLALVHAACLEDSLDPPPEGQPR